MKNQLLHHKTYNSGPGIKIVFEIHAAKIQQINLHSRFQSGLNLEIWSDSVEKDLFSKIEEWFLAYSLGKNPNIKLPLNYDHLPPFMAKVLIAMQELSFGQTCTYGELAQQCGSPRAARAVGSSCRKNPFPIVVPCHRVLNANQKLAGYSAGGLEMKKKLLDFEGVYIKPLSK